MNMILTNCLMETFVSKSETRSSKSEKTKNSKKLFRISTTWYSNLFRISIFGFILIYTRPIVVSI
ncbi:MAG: hypothetical protein MAG551_00204 [Candidatus Scalindua arabica]|uniref:Uncharacterized protein n=1 Tax=Candidatus Scalindua arabica TaxID=1127984 RepID=A0A941W087_9BACT|nr:hypothetical protein [Candidatus Scalindua arabica]